MNGIVFTLGTSILVLLMIAALQSRKKIMKYESAWSPLTVFVAIFLIAGLDFAALDGVGYSTIFRGNTYVQSDALAYAFFMFCVFGLVAFCSLFWGLSGSSRKAIDNIDFAKRYHFHLLIWMAPTAALALFLLQATDWNPISLQYRRQEILGGNPVASIVSYMTLLAGIYAAAAVRLRLGSVAVLAYYVVAVSFLGGRSFLLLIFAALTINITRNKGIELRRIHVLLSLPFLLLAVALSYFYLREGSYYADFFEFYESRGGFQNLTFGSADISMADAFYFSVIYEGPKSALDFIVGPFVYPLPRAIFPLKPEGTSSAFTIFFDQFRWEITSGSQVVTTGFGDVFINLGPFFGAAFLVPIFVIIGRVARSAFVKNDPAHTLFVVLALYWTYVFLRSDFYNLGPTIWCAFATYLYFKVLENISPVRSQMKVRNPARAY